MGVLKTADPPDDTDESRLTATAGVSFESRYEPQLARIAKFAASMFEVPHHLDNVR